MTDPEPVKEEISEEAAGPVDETMDVPATTTSDEAGSPAVAAPDTASEKKRKNVLITIGVVVVIIIAAIGAFVLLSGPVATKGDTVAIFFTESFDNGTVYTTNMNTTAPVVFTLGNSSVISGIQNTVTGMRLGDTKTVDLPYTEAYGPYDPGLVQTINRTGPIANTTFTPGEYYTVYYRPINAYRTVKILNVTDKTITWDANNPLAGENLTVTIKLVNITPVNFTASSA